MRYLLKTPSAPFLAVFLITFPVFAQRAELVIQTRHALNVKAIAFSPDGQYMSTGDTSGAIKLWRADSGTLIRNLNGHVEEINSIVFSPDSKILASGSADMTIRLWDIVTGEMLRSINSHNGSVNCIAFSKDGEILVSGSGSPFGTTGDSKDSTIKMWEVNTGKELCTIDVDANQPVDT